MRKARFPHAWTGVLACLICIVFSGLFLTGCGGDTPPDDPMAELKAAFPEGRPGLTGVEGRMEDPAYAEKISDGARQFMSLSSAVAQAREKLDDRAKAVADALKAADPAVTPEAVEAALAADADWLRLQELLKQAEAEAEVARQANMRLIRDKATARQREYDALKAKLEAEAAAKTGPAAN